jgi:hypothetical protein
MIGLVIMSCAAWLLSWYKAEVNKSGKRPVMAVSADLVGSN